MGRVKRTAVSDRRSALFSGEFALPADRTDGVYCVDDKPCPDKGEGEQVARAERFPEYENAEQERNAGCGVLQHSECGELQPSCAECKADERSGRDDSRTDQEQVDFYVTCQKPACVCELQVQEPVECCRGEHHGSRKRPGSDSTVATFRNSP